jgi:hypothetical protein
MKNGGAESSSNWVANGFSWELRKIQCYMTADMEPFADVFLYALSDKMTV